ncbi:hypothetical protein [Streptomyces blattellae]|uniref:hypothetical protein n=1 Tax=Streptomyces blattellae TaxID=2569855 RepID=UPI0012B9C4D9|nr:hypothetical protein [Streptomyces blattellae]
MGRHLTAVAWLERHYDDLFAERQGVVLASVSGMGGLKVISYAPDPYDVRFGRGPLLSIKPDYREDAYALLQAASWPDPEPQDDLDDHESQLAPSYATSDTEEGPA